MNEIKEILNESQHSTSQHFVLAKRLELLYRKINFHTFTNKYLEIFCQVLRCTEESAALINMTNFMGLFAGHVITVENDMEPDEQQFLKYILERIFKINYCYNTPSSSVKLCKFLFELLNNLGDEVQVEPESCLKIQKNLLELLQNSKAHVRREAAYALTRLQDPENPDCPVLKQMTAQLLDKSPLVRKAIVQKLAPSKKTLEEIAFRTRDCDPDVRTVAFKRAADIGIKYFRIVQRQYMVRNGFGESDLKTRKVFLKYFLPKCLSEKDGDYVALLDAFRLDADEMDIRESEKLSRQILSTFLRTNPIDDFIKQLPLEESKLIAEDKVKTWLTLYWNILAEHLQGKEDLEEYLDMILPDLPMFCDYIERLAETNLSNPIDEFAVMDFQCILQYLLEIAARYDLADNANRSALNDLVKTILKKYLVSEKVLEILVKIGIDLNRNRVHDFMFDVLDIIQQQSNKTGQIKELMKFGKCLDIFAMSMQNLNVWSDDIAVYYESLVKPMLELQVPELRAKVFKCLSIACLLNKPLAEEHLDLLLQPVLSYSTPNNDQYSASMLQNSALVGCDLLQQDQTIFQTQMKSVGTDENTPTVINDMLNVFLDMLDDEGDNVRETAANVVLKLLLNNRFVSPMMITRIVLKWYNCTTGADLQQFLGLMIGEYANRVPNARKRIGTAVVPIVTQIVNAPRTSPLADVPIQNVINFLTVLTATTSVTDDRIIHVHTMIAKQLVGEILSNRTKATNYMIKLLTQLTIPTEEPSPSLREIISGVHAIIDLDFWEKAVKKSLIKFLAKLEKRNETTILTEVTNDTIATTKQSLESTADVTTSAPIQNENLNEYVQRTRNSDVEPIPPFRSAIRKGPDPAVFISASQIIDSSSSSSIIPSSQHDLEATEKRIPTKPSSNVPNEKDPSHTTHKENNKKRPSISRSSSSESLYQAKKVAKVSAEALNKSARVDREASITESSNETERIAKSTPDLIVLLERFNHEESNDIGDLLNRSLVVSIASIDDPLITESKKRSLSVDSYQSTRNKLTRTASAATIFLNADTSSVVVTSQSDIRKSSRLAIYTSSSTTTSEPFSVKNRSTSMPNKRKLPSTHASRRRMRIESSISDNRRNQSSSTTDSSPPAKKNATDRNGLVRYSKRIAMQSDSSSYNSDFQPPKARGQPSTKANIASKIPMTSNRLTKRIQSNSSSFSSVSSSKDQPRSPKRVTRQTESNSDSSSIVSSANGQIRSATRNGNNQRVTRQTESNSGRSSTVSSANGQIRSPTRNGNNQRVTRQTESNSGRFSAVSSPNGQIRSPTRIGNNRRVVRQTELNSHNSNKENGQIQSPKINANNKRVTRHTKSNSDSSNNVSSSDENAENPKPIANIQRVTRLTTQNSTSSTSVSSGDSTKVVINNKRATRQNYLNLDSSNSVLSTSSSRSTRSATLAIKPKRKKRRLR